MRNKKVKVILAYPDKRIRIHKATPQGNKVTVNGNSYIIDPERVFLHKNTPTFVCVTETTEPLNLYDVPNNELHTADTFNVALKAKVMTEFLNATRKGLDAGTLGLMVSVITLIAVIGFGYFLRQDITNLLQHLGG